MATPVLTPAPEAATVAARRLIALRGEVAAAAQSLKRCPEVPAEAASLIHDFGDRLYVDSASLINPNLAKELWRAGFEASNALWVGDPDTQRVEVRMALQNLLDVLDEIIEDAPFGPTVPIKDVLGRTDALLQVPQEKLAELLAVSPRTLQRWLRGEGTPGPREDARLRTVGALVNQLRHTLTPPGVYAWFSRENSQLGRRPLDLLDDPLRYPELLDAAAAPRSMSL